MMEGKSIVKIDSIEELTQKWNNVAPVYKYFDSCAQTFYYNLINMMDLGQAKHILEVACGTGKLLCLALQLKDLKTTYLATDLCENMISIGKELLKQEMQKMGVEQPIEEWLQRHNLTFKVANGEEPIQAAYKFDRIIANLVLMATQDPVKMMKSLYSRAEQGCLLGVTVWGDQTHGNLLTIMNEAMKVNNIPIPNQRPHSHLYNRLEWLAKQSGWDVVVQWQQNTPFHFTHLSRELEQVVKYWCRGNSLLIDFYFNRIKEIFASKKVLNFPVQMAIMRKK